MRPAPDAVMIFAAGFGTRMGALTADRPKPLIQVANKPLIDHALALADAAGIARKVVNLHYRADMLAEYLAGRRDVTVSRETPLILDTGGGLRHALPLLGPGSVFTLNSDAVWTEPNPLTTLADAWDVAMGGLVMLVPAERATGHGGRGDFDMDAEGRLSRGRAYVYTGAQIVDPAGLLAIPDSVFSLNLLWDALIAKGKLFGILHPGGWCDVGTPEGIIKAEAMLAGARDV
jgi:N-acetyl-alpha-D-muramate 1-phosphate uridylyltransferase